MSDLIQSLQKVLDAVRDMSTPPGAATGKPPEEKVVAE